MMPVAEKPNRLAILTDDMLAAITDPMSAVLALDILGGASPRRVREHARRIRRRVAVACRWNSARRIRITEAESALLAAARALASEPSSTV